MNRSLVVPWLQRTEVRMKGKESFLVEVNAARSCVGTSDCSNMALPTKKPQVRIVRNIRNRLGF